MATTTSTPEAILDAVGGAENIIHFTHCATRLRFELKDASGIDKATVEAIPGVMGAVPQSGDRYQIVIGGAVQSVYDEINSLPAMKNQGGSSGSGQSDADVKAAARAKARGKNAYVDAFFEYLSDSFRPLLPALLGASLIIAGEAICEAFGLINTHADAAESRPRCCSSTPCSVPSSTSCPSWWPTTPPRSSRSTRGSAPRSWLRC